MPMRNYKLQNHNGTAVTRVVWRAESQIRFREIELRRPLEGGQNIEFLVGQGRIDFCFEFANGTRVFSPGIDDTFSFFLIPKTETRAVTGRCDDTL